MNWDYVAHIVRDVFHPHDTIINYGRDQDLIDVFRSSEHDIEAWGLYTGRMECPHDYAREWEWPEDDTFFGQDFADVFMSFNYAPRVLPQHRILIAERVSWTLHKDGFVFFVNPGDWVSEFDRVLTERIDLIAEIKRFHMFRDETVMVYS